MLKICLQGSLLIAFTLAPLFCAAHALDANPGAELAQYTDDEYAAEWKQYLSGLHLVYRSAYGGDASGKDYYLCSDGRLKQSSGTARFRADEGISVYGNARQRRSGRWHVVAFNGRAHLVFIFGRGDIVKRPLENRNGQIFLGGRHYFVAENDQCK